MLFKYIYSMYTQTCIHVCVYTYAQYRKIHILKMYFIYMYLLKIYFSILCACIHTYAYIHTFKIWTQMILSYIQNLLKAAYLKHSILCKSERNMLTIFPGEKISSLISFLNRNIKWQPAEGVICVLWSIGFWEGEVPEHIYSCCCHSIWVQDPICLITPDVILKFLCWRFGGYLVFLYLGSLCLWKEVQNVLPLLDWFLSDWHMARV